MEISTIFHKMSYGPAPESTVEAQAWLEKHKRSFELFIDGEWVKGQGHQFATINPANEEELADIRQADASDVDRAVQAAAAAFAPWQALSCHARARYLYALARQIQKHSRLFAVLETLDNGKPIRESRDIDIPLVARHFYHHAGWAQLRDEQFADYEPLGVVGQIIPWNFPLLMLAWKIAPALAMGNTVVLKPAEYTSLTALLFAEICQQIELPAGVVNIITGDGKTGELLVQHPMLSKVAFTGSTEVGRIIRKATAGTSKKLSLELGGKSPFIVFDDADLDGAVEGIVDAIWFNQGEVCCAGSRLLVQESVQEAFLQKLKARMAKLRVGDPMDKSTDIGAIVAPVQLQRIQGMLEKGMAEGGHVFQPEISLPEQGSFFPPTLCSNISPASFLAQEEIFGPVLVSMPFRHQEEAVKLANNTAYGLAASIWTENINLALDIAPQIKAGTIWVNSTNVFDASAGFGGYRESGFGREGGREGLFEYMKPRWEKGFTPMPGEGQAETTLPQATPEITFPTIDRTPKMYIGGKQTRPDSGYVMPVLNASQKVVGTVGKGNRKDIRNAVEAAQKGQKWRKMYAHQRAQVLYYIAENLSARADYFQKIIVELTACSDAIAQREVETSLSRIFSYAAYADKFEGAVHQPPTRSVTLAMHEPVGVIGMICPNEMPLLAFVSMLMPALAMGNCVVIVPSERYPLLATDLYQVFDTSDVPAGAVNIVTGEAELLAEVLAKHDDVDGLWYMRNEAGSTMVERLAAENMKRTWVNYGLHRDWFEERQSAGEAFLRHAVEVKNIWIPYGD